jgi:hypothetical protein
MGIDQVDKIEFHSGYRGAETPRFVILSGIRHGVARVLSRKRVLDQASREVFEVFRCRLDNGRAVSVRRPLD